MPQIKILDRHQVTTIERTKAAALSNSPSKTAKKSVLSKAGQGIMKGFSSGERDLYRVVRNLNFERDQEERAEL